MLQEFDNTFKLKKGMLVSNIYADYIKSELSKKLDVDCGNNFTEFKNNLNSTDNSYDYLVVVYDKDEDSDGETLGKLDGILYDILYERLILVADETTVDNIKLEDKGFTSKVIDYSKGFIFNDIVKELKGLYREDIEELNQNDEHDNEDGIGREDINIEGVEINDEVYSDSLNSDIEMEGSSEVVALNDILGDTEDSNEDSDLDDYNLSILNSESDEDNELSEYDLFEDDIVMFNKEN